MKHKNEKRCTLTNKFIGNKEVVIVDYAIDYVKQQGYLVVKPKTFKLTFIILIGFICIIALSRFTYALDSDNIKSYNATSETVTFTDRILGFKVATATLNTPKINYVMYGKDRKVAEITINSFQDYPSFLKDIELINLKTGIRIIRDINYKYKSSVNYSIRIPEYKEVCLEVIPKNETKPYIICNDEIIGYKDVIEKRDVWIPLEKLDIKTEKLTIGIYSDVLPNDNIEWFITLFGIKINEWATWTTSFNIGLRAGWTMNETGTPILRKDIFSLSNATGEYRTNSTGGKIGLAVVDNEITSNSGDRIYANNTPQIQIDGNFTISFWVYFANYDGYPVLLWKRAGLSGTEQGFSLAYNTVSQVQFHAGNQNMNLNLFNSIATGRWIHHVMTWNDATKNGTLWINGTVQTSGIAGSVYTGTTHTFFFGNPSAIGNYNVNRSMDEIYIWNRTLSSTEIIDLYNNGVGITYVPTGADVDVPQIKIIYPVNSTIYKINVSSLNYSVTDASPLTCYYSINAGLNNYTLVSCNNLTGLISQEGSNIWMIGAVDSAGLRNYSIVYFTKSTITSISLCLYKEFGYYNINLPWFREVNCL